MSYNTLEEQPIVAAAPAGYAKKVLAGAVRFRRPSFGRRGGHPRRKGAERLRRQTIARRRRGFGVGGPSAASDRPAAADRPQPRMAAGHRLCGSSAAAG